MTLPLPLAPWVEQRFLKIDSDTGLLVPNGGGFVATKIAGSSSDLTTYTNPTAPLVAQENPIELDSDGRPPSPIYLLGRGYKFIVYDSDMVELYTIPLVEDSAFVALTTTANVQAEGTTATGAGPYVVLSTDNTVIVNSATANYVVQLPAAADRGTPLVVKTIQNSLRITPSGSEVIEGIAAFYQIPAAASPLMPTVTLISDGVSGWLITGGIGI